MQSRVWYTPLNFWNRKLPSGHCYSFLLKSRCFYPQNFRFLAIGNYNDKKWIHLWALPAGTPWSQIQSARFSNSTAALRRVHHHNSGARLRHTATTWKRCYWTRTKPTSIFIINIEISSWAEWKYPRFRASALYRQSSSPAQTEQSIPSLLQITFSRHTTTSGIHETKCFLRPS